MVQITRRRGFTLIELLVVIAIIAILIGLLVPAVQKVREAASRSQCQNNLHQIGAALHNYHGVYKKFPSGSHSTFDNYWYWSWLAFILPYIEQDNLYKQAVHYAQTGTTAAGGTVGTSPGGNTWWWNPALGAPQIAFICPADPRGEAETVGNTPAWLSYAGMNPGTAVAFTMYLGSNGTNSSAKDGVLYLDSHVRFVDITDGTSNTLLVGERPPSQDLNFGWWFAGYGYDGTGTGDVVMGAREVNYTSSAQLNNFNPSTGSATTVSCSATNVGLQMGNAQNPCDQTHYWSPHSAGANFLFADGSVHFLALSANSVLPALATRNGGETIMPDW